MNNLAGHPQSLVLQISIQTIHFSHNVSSYVGIHAATPSTTETDDRKRSYNTKNQDPSPERSDQSDAPVLGYKHE